MNRSRFSTACGQTGKRSGFIAGDGEGRMASTMMPCIDGMEQEATLMAALEEVRGFRLTSQHLELNDASGRMFARLESRNLD